MKINARHKPGIVLTWNNQKKIYSNMQTKSYQTKEREVNEKFLKDTSQMYKVFSLHVNVMHVRWKQKH